MQFNGGAAAPPYHEMRAVTFQSVLNGLAMAAGLVIPRDLSLARAQTYTEYINRRVEECWKFDFWPEWTPCEQRVLRPYWNNATAYAAPAPGAPVEVFFPATVSYYQALQANTNQAPAIEVNGTWQVNEPYWALSWQSYGVPIWPAWAEYGVIPTPTLTAPDWQPNTAYTGGSVGVCGSQVRNPNDNNFYQCIVTHVSGATFDGTKWGLLTPFNKYLSLDQPGLTPIGQVKRVCKQDPYVFPKTPGEIPFRVSRNGLQLKQDAPAIVYVEYRMRPPVFTSAVWNSATAYAAGVANVAQVMSSVDGNCYYALQPTTGNEPSASPADWGVVEFPEVLATAVKRFALADAFRDQKQNDRADDEEERAREKLQDVLDEELASQGQYEAAKVETYGGGN